MSARDAALAYAAKGWPVFPVSARKVPMIPDWGHAATTNAAQIAAWWTHAPHALIGTPTGEPLGELADRSDGIAALDIDMKGGKNGLRSLAKLGIAELPRTPTVLTRIIHRNAIWPREGESGGTSFGGVGDAVNWV
jgi:hypothetical protein